uniref:Sulfotransferase domain-containing protein n=1 Tax=Candidatus Kentrum sp. DK TaxID=2126562 RepID=A0A450T5Y8_9GAMM|nr:MAG: hypothetical protein BECKDK2373C_GA0170839_10958 [Candidatus Kentron sp. DK]
MKNIRHSYTYIRRCMSNRALPESVYFYTFHKCASTLFSRYVLKNVDGLYNMDYASQISSGNRVWQKKLTFEERGFIYGPIRISANETTPVGKMLVKPTIGHDFIRDKVALFLVRDPRDILISSYYSFGFTHGLSRVVELRKRQENRRKRICKQTLDEYVLQAAENQIKFFGILYDLSNACERSVILKYEDMVDDFDTFTEQLRRYVFIKDSVIHGIYERSRPRKIEDLTSHRRSGQVQGFRHKLEEGTIDALSRKLADTLSLFGYKA